MKWTFNIIRVSGNICVFWVDGLWAAPILSVVSAEHALMVTAKDGLTGCGNLNNLFDFVTGYDEIVMAINVLWILGWTELSILYWHWTISNLCGRIKIHPYRRFTVQTLKLTYASWHIKHIKHIKWVNSTILGYI